MATIAMQREIVVAFKKETILNLGILSKLQEMPSELSRQIFKEKALQKPTQNLFFHLSYYLVSIIDTPASSSLPWPLYDTKTERAYRNELSNFISNYSNKGLLAPIISSYLVNPSCYKVTKLIFQMSQLALHRVLMLKMVKDTQKKQYSKLTEDYKEDIMDNIEKETAAISRKFSNHLHIRAAMEKIAELFRNRITEMENRITELNPQQCLDKIVDGFLQSHEVGETEKAEILKIKDVNQPCSLFDDWLAEVDNRIIQIEKEWDTKTKPFLQISSKTCKCTEMIIARQLGENEKSSYTLEYNPQTDEICTKELQSQVNSEQKYILKNIIRDDKLIFTNLIRAFLVSIGFILKNTEIGDEIYKFNECLDGGRQNYTKIISELRVLLDRVMNGKANLQRIQTYKRSSSQKEFSKIPHYLCYELPNLADLKMGKDLQSQVIFDTFTPFNTFKHQLNLRRRTSVFAKPQSLLSAPFYQGPRDDFLKSLISCRISSHDRPNTTHKFNNMSIRSHTNYRNNETIAECSSGFTKQQITRLLSTKKSSSCKKFEYKTERPDNVKKGGLFNESVTSTDANNLFRSHSSPNLFDNRVKRSQSKIPIPRKLSVMQEVCPLLEVSGIMALENDNFYVTPDSVMQLETNRMIFDATSLSTTPIISEPGKVPTNIQEVHFGHLNVGEILEDIIDKEDNKTETPKSNSQLIRKTSSIEKIINRYKKVRNSNLPCEKSCEDASEFKTIVEEKENLNTHNVDVFTANRDLLPDLLSPNCSVTPKKSMDYLDPICFDDEPPYRKPRESLGTALGVDHTFLDQFDLMD